MLLYNPKSTCRAVGKRAAAANAAERLIMSKKNETNQIRDFIYCVNPYLSEIAAQNVAELFAAQYKRANTADRAINAALRADLANYADWSRTNDTSTATREHRTTASNGIRVETETRLDFVPMSTQATRVSQLKGRDFMYKHKGKWYRIEVGTNLKEYGTLNALLTPDYIALENSDIIAYTPVARNDMFDDERRAHTYLLKCKDFRAILLNLNLEKYNTSRNKIQIQTYYNSKSKFAAFYNAIVENSICTLAEFLADRDAIDFE